MQLETWIPSCVLFDWWFSPWELWEYWLLLHWGPYAQPNGWL
uniref:Uncharacterized protein n=1 Tax=Trichinella nativa TaxID=6335 RepID=A0A0V1KH06_9BILA